MSDNIKVVVKVRPLIPREIDDQLGYQWRVNNNTLYQIDQNGRDCGPCYTFDKVYNKDTNTCDVYNDIAKPIVEAATAGFNGTIFAYGQTSSGKTYTMTGTKNAPGIIPLAVINLFDIIKNIPDRDFLVRVSYVEIYNETLIDLLDIKKIIKISETHQGVKVDATEKLTTSPEEVLEIMREGKANRQTGATNMNEESSRSHSIFQITIESREHIEGEEEVGSVNVSQLNLVDLAGSERSGQTGATGIRFKEGTHINKSLSALALVIKQLSDDPNPKHVNYRDSKLTRILQNSLGGNAKTSIICAVTPAAVEETISTLQFANRAKNIKNSPAVNAVATDVTMIQTLTKQLSALKTQLESKKHVEQDNYKLQKQIGGLQRLILNGFAQRTTDLTGTRRKLYQPRRVTISTLHPIQEDTVPAIPKFCTPSLKYNPMSIESSSDFEPIKHAASLSTVSEELRLVTPPPTDKKIDYGDEIIELESSKTPPCILRKNAKQAEKNLKDIVELTEREKIYTPNIVELMEKLENKSSIIAKLEDDLKTLGRLSNEKDLEMERLRSNVNKLEGEIKVITSAKADLETACKDYSTKLTDWEVSYETLKKKAKSREEELLSLLQEHETKNKHKNIGKLASKAIDRELTNFMDLSKNISLVSSDNENSIINIEEKQGFELPSFNSNMESEISLKDKTVLELKSYLESQKLKIESLEKINREFQDMVNSYKEKLSYIENENSLHKSTIENLNNTIENQKTEIENINADVNSYNSVIQELQIKLAKREEVTENLSDVELEGMITNEEMFIANNENMKNIIQSLKAALNSRNEEIKNLKLSLDRGKISELSNMEEEIESKKTEISRLLHEVERLKTQSNDNIVVVDKLLEEKTNLLQIEQRLQTQLDEIQKEKEMLNETIAQQNIEIEDLKHCKEKLISDLEEKEREILSAKQIHEEQFRTMSQKIIELEGDIKLKDESILSLQQIENKNQEYLDRVQLNIHKFNKIMVLFTGNILEVPEKMNDLVSALNVLGDKLTSLETLVSDSIEQKKQVAALLEQRETELEALQSHINDLSNAIDSFYEEYESFAYIDKDKIFDKYSVESENNALNTCANLKNKVMHLITAIKSTQTYLKQTLQDKEKELNEISVKYERTKMELDKESNKATQCLQRVDDLTDKRDNLLQNILEKATGLTSECNIENSISCQFNSDPENMYEQIILTLEKIANHISIMKCERETKHDNTESILSDARTEIKLLTEENMKLIRDITSLENSNSALTSEIKRIHDDSQTLSKLLQESKDLLNQMQNNLVTKDNEIKNIETKTIEWKDKFRNLEIFMKEQIVLLEYENLELKSKCSELELQDKQRHHNNENKEVLNKPSLYTDGNSPPSLLKICCDRIIDAMSSNEDDKTIGSDNSIAEDPNNISCAMKNCKCNDLLSDLDALKTDNIKLKTKIEELENENANLLREQEDVHKEVQLLIEHTYELQKKILNHRTNLSTLTATTYAENRSLSSKVKFLQHHHNRFHILCQREIPDFKRQLQELFILLKSENLGKLNESIKRYSLPNALESVPSYSQFKNESTIDGDLLMLDTNISLTTCDNTLISHDQTCFDITQVCTYNEVACQTNLTELSKCHLSYPQIKLQSLDEMKIVETLESLKIENDKLREVVDEYTRNKKSKCLKDTQSSPIKITINPNEKLHSNNNNEDLKSCESCKYKEETYKKEIDVMTKKLMDLEAQKVDIESKYKNLSLEVASTEILVRKLGILENDNCNKQNEIDKLNSCLKKKCEELKTLQVENDILSNQVFESVSEVDDLKKEHDSLKEINNNLTNKFSQLEKEIDRLNMLKSGDASDKQKQCTECTLKDEIINTLNSKATNSHQKLDRSYSDSDSSSRYNKICTLQNELHAGKKDCIELKEQVTTIKNHLERSDLSMGHAMDLDESMGDSHVCSFNQDFNNVKSHDNKFNMPDIPEERLLDSHTEDKINCLNYYIEKTDADKESLTSDMKILDVMKMLYEYIENKHANEIENLNNKLRDFEELKTEIQMQLNKANLEQNEIAKELKEKNSYLKTFANIVSQIRNNLADIKSVDSNNIVNNFIDKFLMIIDKEFGFTSTEIFELVIRKIKDIYVIEAENKAIENAQINNVIQEKTKEIESLNEMLSELKSQIIKKEDEFNLLERQKEKVHEISMAVTLDIVQKEKILREQVFENYKKLLEYKIINENIDTTLPTIEIIKLVFENVLNSSNKNNTEVLEKEKNALVIEVDELKKILGVKEKELQSLRNETEKIHQENKKITLDLSEKEHKLHAQITLHENLDKMYKNMIEENDSNLMTIKKLTEDVSALKADISSKEVLITSLESKLNNNIEDQVKITELLQFSESVQKEIDQLKSINEVLLKEKETCAKELEIANGLIKQHKIDFEKLTSDILVLKETVKENSDVTENLRLESKRLLEEKLLIQSQLQEKCKEYSRIEDNIKKHEKTAEIQSGIIIRLKKQKQADEKICLEKDNQIDELKKMCKTLETQHEELAHELQLSKEKIDELTKCRDFLQSRVSEVESDVHTKPRLSIDMADSSRRRRQSIHDSKRMFSDDIDDHIKMEAVFKSHTKAEDFLMDVDESSSNRSTPLRTNRGRDSVLSKHDQSSRDEDSPRGGGAGAVGAGAPREAREERAGGARARTTCAAASPLKKQLSSCQQELEELKERYKELDEECETCAEYLKERDEQCIRLKKDKLALENIITDLKDKLKNSNPNYSSISNSKINLVNAAVNTDEDWTNLHSVVVDRMSFDAEVEKNKKLMKTIEELRFKMQDLKKTMAKMQKAFEKNTIKDSKELETTKAELQSCKQELETLKEKYKELDDECETCAEYLRERDDQCRKLKEAKAVLEAKLQEYQDSSNITQSVRKRRQSLHDKNRCSPTVLRDASTETNEDLLSSQNDDNTLKTPDDRNAKELKRLKAAVEKLSQHKAALEHQLLAASAAPLYVATGSAIIQNQQLTDVMKENQKLKKMNAKLVTICKKRGKSLIDSNRENEDPMNN
ncbi:unnamed protein product [Euphydryas editha]|uniref:Kinesin motor domain-containing protein n=1 Tax=Euphydryas editha TaxID=104508 RepID=A0AAU9TZC9_EUPED|nr:unnamed protein product [Euphydryas editha]